MMSENLQIKKFDYPASHTEIFNTIDEKFFNYLSLNNMHKENQSKKEFLDKNPVMKSPDYSNLTVIIPFRFPSDLNRMENFKIVMNYLKWIGVENIIISEEDDSSKLDDYITLWEKDFKNLSVVFTESNDLFSRSNSINEGVKKANTSNVVIMDNDVLIQKDVFDESLSLLDSFFDFVYPFNRMVRQIYDMGERVEDFNFDDVKSEIEIRLNADGGCLFCKKESLLNIGGFNPDYKGWGGEDNEFDLRVNLSDYKVIRLNNILYHLYHTKKISNQSNADILMHSANLSRFNDLNILINENKEMYYNSLLYKKEHIKPVNEKYLISVVIPIYNCEFFYLDRCINSLKNQSLGFENIEVILVDDASIYNTSKNLIKRYVKRYENVKAIFLEENSGAGIARNAGIKAASSEYVTFLDHDDYYLKDVCKTAYTNLKKYDADIIITNFIHLESMSSTSWKNLLNLDDDKKFLNNSKEFMDVFLIAPSTGTKTYRREFLLNNDLFYKGYKVGEDLLFNHKSLFKANGIILIDTPSIVYSFRRNDNEELTSSSLDYSKETLIGLIYAYKDCYDLFKNYAPDYTYIILGYLNYFLNEKLFKSNFSFDEFVEICEEFKSIGSHYYYEDRVYKSHRCLKITELIINDEFSKAYEKYSEFV